MSIQDHQGTRKYKFILPFTFFLMIAITVFGPLYFTQFYRLVLMLSIITIFYRQTSTVIGIVHTAWMYYQNIRNQQQIHLQTQPQIGQLQADKLVYAFIIPNYKQDEEMLVQVVSMLKEHRRAKQQYAIFLAMEDAEPASDEKACRIISKFPGCFRSFEYTVHKIRPFEQRGKASNVTWCCEQMDQLYEKNNIDHNKVVLVVQDADSWVSELYIDILQRKILSNIENMHRRIYAPFKTMLKIDYSLPVFNRANEKMQLLAIFNAQVGVSGVGFPISHYSLSYNLAKQVQFWDTIPDAIGEDFFMTSKTFWKTQCKVKCQRIHAPVNSDPVSSGMGYISDIKAKFWQIQRHMQGAADFGYNFKFFFKNINNWKAWVMMIVMIEVRIVPITFPIIFTYIPQDQYLTLFNHKIQIVFFMGIFFTVTLLILAVTMQIISRMTAKYVWKTQMKTYFVLQVLQFMVLVGPLSLFFVLFPSVYAAFNVFNTDRKYITAPKQASNQSIQSIKVQQI